ncbi:MAG: peptidylprolyl isomerase [Alphaproteobacteria bacterium]|nr:peptidylprolyl isomerase [Alphaproteobacteria bacterium]
MRNGFGLLGAVWRAVWAAALLLSAVVAVQAEEKVPPTDPANTVYMDILYGRVVIELRPDLAPKNVERFKELVRQKFYDGLTFHRVLAGFMAQAGDPKGDGSGGTGQNLPAEFSKEKHVRGTVSMARKANDPNSADSQFFIVIRESNDLDGKYTIIGRVVAGMDHVDRIKKGTKALDGRVVANPDKILQMRMAADVKPK